MEEDINYLDKMVKEYKQFGDLANPEFEDTDRIYNALENLLEKYKQLEKENKELKNNILLESKPFILDCIPKSKIKEKIEELREIMLDTQTKYKGTYALLDEWRNAKAQENILIRLLEEE